MFLIQESGLCIWAFDQNLILTLFSDKKLNGYCKCTSSIVFVYPPYARCPSEFDRFWYLFMCAAGELRVRYVCLCVLVVGIVLITKWKSKNTIY